MAFEPKNYDRLIGTPGFSDTMMKNHFTLYQGYVTNTNKVADTLAEMVKAGKFGTPEYNELKRRFGWEFNGVRLHELYFENMSKTPAAAEQKNQLAAKILENFGTWADWEKDFRATGGMRGIGWTILYYDTITGRLFNTWINEHDFGHLAGAKPLLILDVFEHAYMLDYGLKRADYIEAFMKSVDWQIIASRFQK